MNQAMKKYSKPIAQAINLHGPIVGILTVVHDITDKALKIDDDFSRKELLAEAKQLLTWTKKEIAKIEREGDRR